MAKISDSIHAIAQTQEERILLAQIARKAETTAEKGYLTCTRFLDMHEHAMAARLLRELGGKAQFWGGYDHAERQIFPAGLDGNPAAGGRGLSHDSHPLSAA